MIRNENTHYKKVAFLSSVLIFFGMTLVFYNYYETKKLYAFDYMNNILYDQEQVLSTEVETEFVEEKNEEPEPVVKQAVNNNLYIGTLEIPKLNFKRGFLNNGDEANNVDKNLFTVNSSTMPDQENNNLIIAAHSGTGPIAFFKDLYKLSLDDEAVVTYKNKKYYYQITNIYNVPKTGVVRISRDTSKNVLTLITCTFQDKTSQTVYILELVKTI